jgi:hypothetical protein
MSPEEAAEVTDRPMTFLTDIPQYPEPVA